jgi:hypothetical protein
MGCVVYSISFLFILYISSSLMDLSNTAETFERMTSAEIFGVLSALDTALGSGCEQTDDVIEEEKVVAGLENNDRWQRFGLVDYKRSNICSCKGLFARDNGFMEGDIITECVGKVVETINSNDNRNRYIIPIKVLDSGREFQECSMKRLNKKIRDFSFIGINTFDTSLVAGTMINDLSYIEREDGIYVLNESNHMPSNSEFITMSSIGEHGIPPVTIPNDTTALTKPFKIRMFVRAIRQIDPGAELSLAYGSAYWSHINYMYNMQLCLGIPIY